MSVLICLRWCFWAVSAVVVGMVAFYVVNSFIFENQKYNIGYFVLAAVIIGILVNLFFKDTRFLYFLSAAFPVVLFAVRPDLLALISGFFFSILMGFVSFSLDIIRRKV